MKKTLLVTNFFPPAIGGIENYYFNLCKLLDTDKLVVLAQEEQNEKDYDLSQLFPVYRSNFFGGKISPRWWHLKKEINDICQIQKIENLVFGHFHNLSILGRYQKLPYFVFAHGTDVLQAQNNFLQNKAFKEMYKGVNTIIANSNFLAGEIEKITGDKQKIKVIYPGINFDELNQSIPDMAKRKEALGIGANDIVMLSLGRLVAEKRYEAIINMMPTLLEKLPNLKYLIVGEGPEKEALHNLIGQLDLTDKIKLIDKVETGSADKAFYFQAAHLFVTVSAKPEGFGISYLEAQATGTPVVASKFGGSAEAVPDGHVGKLVDPENISGTVEAIYEILSDTDLWQKYSEAGKARAQKEFDWKIQVEKIKNILS
ncbi:MAG: glycosyltransferase family 4 protein [bacterium]